MKIFYFAEFFCHLQRNAHFTKSVNISWCSKYTQTIGYQIIFVPMRTQTEQMVSWKMRPYLFKSALITLKWNSNKVIKSNDLSLLVLANAFRLIIYMNEWMNEWTNDMIGILLSNIWTSTVIYIHLNGKCGIVSPHSLRYVICYNFILSTWNFSPHWLK